MSSFAGEKLILQRQREREIERERKRKNVFISFSLSARLFLTPFPRSNNAMGGKQRRRKRVKGSIKSVSCDITFYFIATWNCSKWEISATAQPGQTPCGRNTKMILMTRREYYTINCACSCATSVPYDGPIVNMYTIAGKERGERE